MQNSAERLQFITECLTNYKIKIEVLNKVGLFDSAKLFECFALIICRLWFGQNFRNLNDKTANYPYVDLLSENEQIYVQVSTAQDIPDKIKKTLDKINVACQKGKFNISKVYFFMLGNESVEKVSDYQIGNLAFKKDEHLITLEDIVARASDNSEFQKKIYFLLKQELEQYTTNETKLADAVATSKTLISQNIDDLLNGEYEIDRKSIIEKIREENKKFITVLGDAGFGKTALCKKLLKTEEIILYTRAERLTETIHLNDIWNLDISKTLYYLNNKKVIFFIDALEFIADCRPNKIELLQQLYDIAQQHENTFIVTTCRTADNQAFFKVGTLYGVQAYLIPELTDAEISLVAEKYPLIRDMRQMKSYAQLLCNPFYLNLIITSIHSVDDIQDVNNFRDHIWHKLICLEQSSLPVGIQKTDIRNCVQQIVFERAKNFLSGISIDCLDIDIVRTLISAGVAVRSGNTIRLKYDIYEDICFEKRIDEFFDSCKGNYTNFFSDIEKLGRCVYRRFQIWVENKLFIKGNQKKFLYHLVFSDMIPVTWKEQTLIGIVKSRFCGSFFDNYGEQIIENGLLKDFLTVVNLFSFEINNFKTVGDNIIAFLRPIGFGRQCLIQLIKNFNIYKQVVYQQSIIKVCTDYACTTKFDNKIDKNTAASICEILAFYIENEIKYMKEGAIVPFHSNINHYLVPVYLLSNHAKDWLKTFFQNMCSYYQSDDRTEHEIGQLIIKHILKNTTPALAMYHSIELIQMAYLYWTFKRNANQHDLFFVNQSSPSSLDGGGGFGFNENAELYKYEFELPFHNQFFVLLSQYNINAALDWLFKITNYAAANYKANNPQDVSVITIFLVETGQKKDFIGNMRFWMAGRQDGVVHDLLGDCLNIAKQMIFNLFDNKPALLREEDLINLAKKWKDRIYQQANNIMMLTVIEEIGKRYSNMLPGYAIELASSMDILLMDIERYGMLIAKPMFKGLENNILKTFGLQDLKERCVQDKKSSYSFQDYMLLSQISGVSSCKLKSEKVLDYLYSLFPNNEEHALEYMQIQKMDARTAIIEQKQIEGKNKTLVAPVLTGFAESLAKEAADNPLSKAISSWVDIRRNIEEKCNNGNYSKEECLSDIDKIGDMVTKLEYGFVAEKYLFELISYAFLKLDIFTEERSRLCDIWIASIRKILQGKSLQFEDESIILLFQQIEKDLNKNTAANLKKLMLDLLLNQENNGRVYIFKRQLKFYLKDNKRIAKALFNTVVKLAEDQMQHNLFNAAYWNSQDTDYTYVPNRLNPHRNIDKFLVQNGGSGFQSKSKVLIEKYLVNEDKLEILDFDIQHYDIGVLCFVSQCGLQLEDKAFHKVMTTLVNETIEILNSGKESFSYFNIALQHEISNFLSNALLSDDADIIVSILFDDKDFSKFRPDTYNFYYSVAGMLLPSFFDGYNNAALRTRCKMGVGVLEKRITAVDDEDVKKRLTKMLLLTIGANGDWSKLKTGYSYEDKMFLNKIWCKYGAYHLRELIEVIYQLQFKELLPEALLSIDHCFSQNKDNEKDLNDVIVKEELLIKLIITKAFFDFSDAIKQDLDLTEAYENILELLVKYEMEEAGVILDEFRIH